MTVSESECSITPNEGAGVKIHVSGLCFSLESQKAVYLINDESTGKMYVGSATGDNGMLLQRWKNYVSNGHGGNQELVGLVAQKGFEYVKNNFTYSILENYNSRVGRDYILQREYWWMETLGTKRFGYNN